MSVEIFYRQINKSMINRSSKILPYLVVVCAVLISCSAAFYSITGLGKFFAGASSAVMFIMGTLEITKLVLASTIYRYWNKFNVFFRTYYTIALIILMSITSAGIYGYLSSAYAKTSQSLSVNETKITALNQQKQLYDVRLTAIHQEKEGVMKDIPNLVQALSNNYVEYKDKSGNIIRTSSSGTRKVIEDQLKSSRERLDALGKQEAPLNDSVLAINSKILEIKTDPALSGDLGPLMYIAKLTDRTPDQVANWFIIALMLVFDPLAISLVIGANRMFIIAEEEAAEKPIEVKTIEPDTVKEEPKPNIEEVVPEPEQITETVPEQIIEEPVHVPVIEPTPEPIKEPEPVKTPGEQFHWKNRR